MYIRSFDEFFEAYEKLLLEDPFTSRVVVKYCQRLKSIIVSLKTDKKTLTHRLRLKTDSKKLEAILHKGSLVLSGNVNVTKADKEKDNQNEGGNNKRRRKNRG